MPVFTISEERHFGECLPFTIFREGVPFAAIVGDGDPSGPATEGDKARAVQLRDALAASEPTPGSFHGTSISEQVRLACSLAGTDSPAGLQELRDIIAYLGRAAGELARIRAAVKAHDDRLDDEDQDGGPQPPTGDDYNDVVSIVMHGAPADPLRDSAPELLRLVKRLRETAEWLASMRRKQGDEEGARLNEMFIALEIDPAIAAAEGHGAAEAPATKDRPRFVIVIDNGCVTDVVSDDPAVISMPYATLDHDTDGMQQDDEVRLIPQAEGEPREGYIREHVVTKAEFPIGPADTYELAPGFEEEA